MASHSSRALRLSALVSGSVNLAWMYSGKDVSGIGTIQTEAMLVV